MSAVQLYLLGTFDLRCGGRSMPKPPTIHSQSLLAYLSVHRHRPQPRDRLLGLFWPERSENRARHSLSTALWQIRRCLPEGVIQSDHQVVQWDPRAHLWLDVESFEAQAGCASPAGLQEAVALYRGDFLDGLFDDWVVDERHRLQTVFVQVLARLVSIYEARAEYEAVLATALRLIEQDPLQELAYRATMCAWCRLGQRGTALEQYRRCQQALQRELGTEPSAETTALYLDILEERFAGVAVAAPTSVAVVVPHRPAGRDPLDAAASSPFVGRDEEQAFLEERWQEAQAGQGTAVFIHGQAGVGKTRLVQEVAQRARWQGGRVLWGRCYEFERLLPYQPVAEALRSALPSLVAADLAGLPPWAAAEVARLVPELGEHVPELPPPVPLPPDQEQARLFDGLARFLAVLAGRGALLLALEDLHWASDSTLRLLHYLARRLAGQSILLLTTLRPEEIGPGHPGRAVQQQLRQEGLAQSLHLGPLAAPAVERWVLDMSAAGEPALPLARRLYDETEGNPFFLVETIKALFQEGLVRLEEGTWKGDFFRFEAGAPHGVPLPLPATLREAIESRVGRLSKEAQAALRLAAVLGREFDLAPLRRAWGQGEEATLEALDDLLRCLLVEEGGGALGRDYAFVHHKVQEVVYAGLPKRRRQRLHARVGAALEEVHGPQAAALAGELAHHFLQAREVVPALTAKAASYLRQAGEQAAARYANAEAVAYFSQALELTPPEDLAGRYALLLAREQVYYLQAARQAEAQDLAALAALAAALGVGQQAEVALLQAQYANATSDFAAGIRAGQETIHLARLAGDARREAAGYMACGRALVPTGDYDAARRALEQALGPLRAARACGEEATCLTLLGVIYYEQGDYVEARACGEQALTICREENVLVDPHSAPNILAYEDLVQGYYDRARANIEQALAAYRRAGARFGEGMELGNLSLAFSLPDPGDCAQARACAEEAVRVCREVADRHDEGMALNELALACLEENDYFAARAAAEQGLHVARQTGDRQNQGWGLGLACAALTQLGDYPHARTCGEEAVRIAREVRTPLWTSWTQVYLELLVHYQGDAELACTYSQDTLRIAQEIGFRFVEELARCHLGHALAGLGRLDEAAAAYREALVGNAEAGWRNRDMAPLAGLARIALAQGDLPQALAHVEEVLRHLATHNLDTTREPLWIYLTCYRVLDAAGDPRAREVLATAHDLLQEWAARIADPELRRSFLESVAANREIGEAYRGVRPS